MTVLFSAIGGLSGIFAQASANADGSGGGSGGGNAEATANADGNADVKTSKNGTSESYTETTRTINGVTTRTVERKKNGVVVQGDEKDVGEDPAGEDTGPWLGLRVSEASPALRDQLGLGENEGVVVDLVASDGPAAKAGLRVNDILLKFEEKPLGTPEDLEEAIGKCQVGQTVAIGYLRRGEKQEANVTLEERPDAGQDGVGEDAETKRKDLRLMREKLREQGGAGNSIKIEVVGDENENIDEILKNPDIPEDFKKSLREMQERMRKFKEKHGAN